MTGRKPHSGSKDWYCGAFQPSEQVELMPYRCTELHDHLGLHRASIDGVEVAVWERRQ